MAITFLLFSFLLSLFSFLSLTLLFLFFLLLFPDFGYLKRVHQHTSTNKHEPCAGTYEKRNKCRRNSCFVSVVSFPTCFNSGPKQQQDKTQKAAHAVKPDYHCGTDTKLTAHVMRRSRNAKRSVFICRRPAACSIGSQLIAPSTSN